MLICAPNCCRFISKSSKRLSKFFGRNDVKASKFAVCAVGILLLGLVRPAMSAAAGAGVPAGAQQQVTHNFDRTAPLPSGQSVRIEHRFGDITVRTHASRDVHVYAAIHVSASSQQDAENYANQIKIQVESSSTGILVRTDYPEHNDSWWGGRNVSMSVEYTIDMPADAPLTIRNKFGKVSVAGLKAATDIDAEQGGVSVHDGHGTQLVRASFGSVELITNDGDADLASTNGSVTASDIKGALTIHDRFGSVRLHRAGASSITNSFGAVEAGDISGDLILRNQNGSVDVTNVNGSADISTSFARITFLNIKQKLACRSQNGAVTGSGVGGSAIIHTSFGNVDVHDIGGPVEVVDQNAKVIVRDVRGGANLKTTFASIDASGIHGDATIASSNAAIHLSDIQGSVDVHTSLGSVSAVDVRGTAHVITGNASVALTGIKEEAYVKTSLGVVKADDIGGRLTVENSNGSVKANNVHGPASVRTSFGSVKLDAIYGSVDVEDQNGTVEVSTASAKSPSGGCNAITIRTSFSPIRVYLDDSAKYDLSAHTSLGRVTSEMPVTTTGIISGDSLNAKINGGGCQLQLMNSNGSIEILKNSSGRR
jgi:hypothetical protein